MKFKTFILFILVLNILSGAFVAVPAVNSNHLSHTGNDYECGTLERKRPLSMTVMEGDLLKKER